MARYKETVLCGIRIHVDSDLTKLHSNGQLKHALGNRETH